MSKKQGEQNIRKITKVGGNHTYSITLPIGMIRKLKWQTGQKVELKIDEKSKRIIIEDWKK